jgi:hypothetical protein
LGSTYFGRVKVIPRDSAMLGNVPASHLDRHGSDPLPDALRESWHAFQRTGRRSSFYARPRKEPNAVSSLSNESRSPAVASASTAKAMGPCSFVCRTNAVVPSSPMTTSEFSTVTVGMLTGPAIYPLPRS